MPISPPGVDHVHSFPLLTRPTIAVDVADMPVAAAPLSIAPETAKPVAPAAIRANPKKRSLKALVADLSSTKTTDASHDCLAATIYHESRAEPLEGQLAVAEVVINRTQSRSFRRTICGVVKQPNQFSFVRGGAIPMPDRNSSSWKRAVAVAKIARDNLWSTSAADALYFHAEHARPSWRHRFARQAALGNHIFYR